MIAMVLAFLRAHWIGATASVFAAGVFATIAVQRLEIDHLKDKLADERVQVARLKAEEAGLAASNKRLVNAINEQNAAIDATVREMNARQKAAAEALARARQDAAIWTARAVKLAAYKPAGDECTAMKAVLKDYYSGILP